MNININFNLELETLNIYNYIFNESLFIDYIKLYCNENNILFNEIYINYNLVSRETQVSINNEFLNHNFNTDIITFNLSENTDILEGDIYISSEQVYLNSKEYEVSFENELNRVLIHGFYHLLGINDKSEFESKYMRSLENKFLEYIETFHVEHE